ncbi:MAG: FAD-binding oxidoreductase, partial [Alphaproteobacteria bacterium]|nr:FAD-binding oxidoreductase [Alphaproteobacteria bacterium]
MARIGDSTLAARLRGEIEGAVLFDPFSRGRYSTDASHYQIEPIGVVVPRTEQDILRVIQIAAEEGVPVLPRGGGTSQCGQTVGEALVVDVSKHFDQIIDFNPDAETISVQPGVALDQLNGVLNRHGLMFMVDVSTSSRATIGGMAGNNSCGARSIRYGTMRDNVHAIDAIMADGARYRFGELPPGHAPEGPEGYRDLADKLTALGAREAEEIRNRFPPLMRRVGGYNIDALVPGLSNRPGANDVNLAHLLVGSEGTLAFSTAIHLKLHRLPTHRVLGICHFPTFYKAMESTQHIVKLAPTAVELVDRTMMDLARDIPLFRPTIERFVKGAPEALLLVEFAGDDQAEQLQKLKQLGELMGDLGFPNAVVEATTTADQREFWDVRKSGLNIMMSMKGDGKPISFIEDCAVPLEDLAEYTDRLTRVFDKHGTKGTWYAHASVGCLHVRPVINLKEADGAKKMRAIAEEAFAMVREYKGSHSGEHGDGIVRSEFH